MMRVMIVPIGRPQMHSYLPTQTMGANTVMMMVRPILCFTFHSRARHWIMLKT